MKQKEKARVKASITPSKKSVNNGTSTSPGSSRAASPAFHSKRTAKQSSNLAKGGAGPSLLSRPETPDSQHFDLSALNLLPQKDDDDFDDITPAKLPILKDKSNLLEEVRRTLDNSSEVRKTLSLVVIGHVDAGKSTLMGHLLYELGRVDEKRKIANERAATKQGKGSFSWAWELDGLAEERERGVTIDIAVQHIQTPHRRITILDAPGHRDFIPNMISGASQADCALLVIDATVGEFESGFDRGGQTREHVLLVRSLGVTQVVVAINKLDQVSWSEDRYSEIIDILKPHLLQVGFQSAKTYFVPVGAMSGVNLVNMESNEAKNLRQWYDGPTLLDLLDGLDPPARPIDDVLRIPITTVFKGQTSLSSGIGVSGRISSGVVQVGERLTVLPGSETTIVRLLEVEDESVPWGAAGTNATLYLSGIDPIHLRQDNFFNHKRYLFVSSVGSVLCSPDNEIPLVSTFNAQIIVFDIQIPLIAGSSVELFQHSRNTPATLSKLLAILDRTTGAVIKSNPRVVPQATSARVEITLRTTTMSGRAGSYRAIPLETFRANKDMGRILLRRNGETVAAGVITEILG